MPKATAIAPITLTPSATFPGKLIVGTAYDAGDRGPAGRCLSQLRGNHALPMISEDALIPAITEARVAFLTDFARGYGVAVVRV